MTVNSSRVSDHPDDLLRLATDIARDAAALITEGRRRGLSDVTTKSSSTDMVTEYDRATEREIVSTLRRLRPHDAIVGEEDGSHEGDSGLTWYIDPIDGTTNFLYDLPMWAVSIGVHDTNGPLCGVVHAPALRETFTATRGGGAHLNGRTISCGSVVDLTQALVATGFNYSAANRVVQANRLPGIIDKIRDVRRLGAASLDLCFVACGRYDGYFEEHLYPWDFAAASLIVTEAGGEFTTIEAESGLTSGVLAANAGLFGQIRALVFD